MATSLFSAVTSLGRQRLLRVLTAAPFALSAALSVAFISRAAFTPPDTKLALFDDPAISMTYARNLVEGHGLLWNPGEPPVEGYTNLFWTLWMAAVHLVADGSRASLIVMVSGAVLLLVNLALIRALATELAPGSRLVELGSLFLTAVSYPLLFWTLTGFEVGLLATLTSGAVLLTLRLRRLALHRDAFFLAATLAVGVLTRDDFAVVAVVLLAFLLPVRPRRLALMAAAGFLVAVLGHEIFRLAYYGDLLPNTYYLKVAGFSPLKRMGAGGTALLHVALINLFGGLALALSAAMHAIGGKGASRAVLIPISVFVAQCVYSVYVGGDAWEYFEFSNRYVAIALPCLFVAAAVGLRVLNRLSRRQQQVVVTTALVAAVGNIALALTGEDFLPPTIVSRGSGTRVATALIGLGLAAALVLFLQGRRRGASERATTSCGVLVVAVLVVSLTGEEFVHYGRQTDEGRLSRAWAADGARLRAALPSDTKIGVFGAGNVPYFSRLRAVDMLGKSDPVIARSTPNRGPFFAGHSKWDYADSLSRHRPDLVVQAWRLTQSDKALFARYGYRPVASDCPELRSASLTGIYARADSRLACP